MLKQIIKGLLSSFEKHLQRSCLISFEKLNHSQTFYHTKRNLIFLRIRQFWFYAPLYVALRLQRSTSPKTYTCWTHVLFKYEFYSNDTSSRLGDNFVPSANASMRHLGTDGYRFVNIMPKIHIIIIIPNKSRYLEIAVCGSIEGQKMTGARLATSTYYKL